MLSAQNVTETPEGNRADEKLVKKVKVCQNGE